MPWDHDDDNRDTRHQAAAAAVRSRHLVSTQTLLLALLDLSKNSKNAIQSRLRHQHPWSHPDSVEQQVLNPRSELLNSDILLN